MLIANILLELLFTPWSHLNGPPQPSVCVMLRTASQAGMGRQRAGARHWIFKELLGLE